MHLDIGKHLIIGKLTLATHCNQSSVMMALELTGLSKTENRVFCALIMWSYKDANKLQLWVLMTDLSLMIKIWNSRDRDLLIEQQKKRLKRSRVRFDMHWECGPMDTLILAQWILFWNSVFRIKFCCFKPKKKKSAIYSFEQLWSAFLRKSYKVNQMTKW